MFVLLLPIVYVRTMPGTVRVCGSERAKAKDLHGLYISAPAGNYDVIIRLLEHMNTGK